jgi:RHS repeat-associated protein
MGTFGYDLRLPGQVFDGQVGLHSNYFRDFDPAVGRYIQSDPLGLRGDGVNTYAYARSNPLSRIDAFGLSSIDDKIAVATATGDVETLETLAEAADAPTAARIREIIARFNSTADQIISKECQGRVRGRFPKSVLGNTLKEILELAKEGDDEAKTAWKLLNDNRFKK